MIRRDGSVFALNDWLCAVLDALCLSHFIDLGACGLCLAGEGEDIAERVNMARATVDGATRVEFGIDQTAERFFVQDRRFMTRIVFVHQVVDTALHLNIFGVKAAVRDPVAKIRFGCVCGAEIFDHVGCFMRQLP